MNKDIVSIIFGDSIAYGLFDDEYCGWVNRIRINLKRKNNFIFNLAIPGQNSLDILNKFEKELINRYNEEDEFKILFSFGIKDALLISNDNKIDNFKNNVLEIIEKSKKYTENIYFIGLLKPDITIRKEYKLDNVILIDNCLEEICKLQNVKYIRIRDLISVDDLSDGLHPNEVGHKKITNIVEEEIY